MARGDQIYTIREFINIQGVYEHHGIDCGDGYVIHYRKKNETISRTSMDTFTQGKKVYVKLYQTCYIPDVVVQRAESRLGEQKYNLLFNNCEHFATWCKIGKVYSQQVEDFVPVIKRINLDSLYQPLNQAFKQTKQENAPQLLNKALADIKVIWDQTQPNYRKAIEEMNTWQQVAIEAVRQNREDLAREAIKRKLDCSKNAAKEKETLDKLAKMTETLLRNQANI